MDKPPCSGTEGNLFPSLKEMNAANNDISQARS
jgi:hypothetical protein